MRVKGASAVMAQRRDPNDALQNFWTPPWAVRSIFGQILIPCRLFRIGKTIWEPACGAGHMTHALADYSEWIFASDVHDWGHGDKRNLDFTFAHAGDAPWPVAWIIANPPFVLAEKFVDRALAIATVGVAMLMRLQWLEGEERYQLLFTDRKPVYCCPFCERVPMIQGAYDPEASTATAYAWFIWLVGQSPAYIRTEHLPPGMKRRYSRLTDMALASPGEAKRRRLARAAAEASAA